MDQKNFDASQNFFDHITKAHLLEAFLVYSEWKTFIRIQVFGKTKLNHFDPPRHFFFVQKKKKKRLFPTK